MLLNGKVVIVTGVGPGMGRQLCLLAAAEGARVVISARSKQFIEQVANEILSQGGEAIAVPTDVGVTAQCEALAAEARRVFGRIDGLVNSARTRGPSTSIEASRIEDWVTNMNVTCLGALRMAKAVLPTMREQRDGAIVNVGTISTVRPYEGEADYAVAKTAMGGLTRQLAKEFGRANIRVNYTRMGYLWGPSIEKFFKRQAAVSGVSEQDLIAEVTARIPLGLIPPDRECAKAVLFLVSDYARMVTGATLDINGGEWMAP